MARALRFVSLLACLAALLIAQPAAAQTEAATFTGFGHAHDSDLDLMVGYEFRVGASPILATHLGYYDYQQNGFETGHHVRIWRATDQQLVASGVVHNSDPLSVGGFRYAQLGSAVQLDANTNYVVAGSYQQFTGDRYVFDASGLTMGSGIELVQGRLVNDITGNLVFPTQTVATNGFFGGSFKFAPVSTEAVPEPGSLMLFLPALGTIVLFRPRRGRGAEHHPCGETRG